MVLTLLQEMIVVVKISTGKRGTDRPYVMVT